MARHRLTTEDWIAAGFRALASAGPSALRAESLARSLGTTKGSFYWHFTDLAAYKAAMLALWREKVATEIIGRTDVAPPGWPRIDALVASAAMPAPDEFGGPGIESAIRAWALSDPDVAKALSEVDSQRQDYLANLLSDVGITDPRVAQIAYAAYIGLDDLASKGRGDIHAGLSALITLLRPKT